MSHSSKKQIHHQHEPYTGSGDHIESKNKNYEELFDSGYNSNIQSKTFLDLDNEFDQQNRIPQHLNQDSNKTQQKNDKFDSVQQWSDSGVCITDSGLSIHEDENYELIYSKEEHKDNKQKRSYEDDSGEGKNSLEIWLKHNSDAETLLHLAIIEGLEDIACSIIQNISTSNELLSSYNYLYQNPLHLAVLKRQMSVIQHLILKGATLTFQDNLGNTPLHIACKYSLIDIVELIISTAQNKSVSKCFAILNYNGDTCLHLAAYNNDLKLLELLIRAGANIDLQEGKSGKTLLHWAVENLHVQLVHFLFKNNANIQAKTFAGKTPLHFLLKASIKNQDSLSLSSCSLNQNVLIKSKIHKIIRMSIEYCNEQKLSLETIGHNVSSSDSDSYEDEN